MSIQRYRTNHISGDYYPDNGGELVLHADHVAEVAAAQAASIRETWDLAVEAERARIRAAVDALWESIAYPASDLLIDVLAIIDGEDTA